MLSPEITYHKPSTYQNSTRHSSPIIPPSPLPTLPLYANRCQQINKRYSRYIHNIPSSIKAIISPSVGKSTIMKGVIIVQPTISAALAKVSVGLVKTVVDGVSDFLGHSFLLELVSSDLDCEYS